MILAPLFLLAATPTQAFNDPAAPCRSASTTYDMVHCYADALGREDKTLNTLYSRILRVLSGPERTGLVNAERSWIGYRDTQCAAEFSLYAGGTGGPPAELVCRWKLTRERSAWLRQSYDWVLKQRER
ncbi:lysozyme inhibitor LprI family protein [Novosphingobium terrae]|jgi:uncharacterized protein YecT (DUF1311 family)|uniref:lysozyme inhibitor LprI family protein n=1 Tax=Novosphingobium terrae TaxID=2726189 RepID=UPI00197E1E77|nr:lysozyme inhibitor LprI family protein [Novosphingobium terrae]